MPVSPTERKLATITGAALSFIFGVLGAGIGVAMDKVFGSGCLFGVLGAYAGTWTPLLAIYLIWWNEATSWFISSGFQPAPRRKAAILTQNQAGLYLERTGS